MKTLIYDKKDRYTLTEEEYKNLRSTISSKGRPPHIDFRGNLFKTHLLEVFNQQADLFIDADKERYEYVLRWNKEQEDIKNMPPKERAEHYWKTWGRIWVMMTALKRNEKTSIQMADNHHNKEKILKKVSKYFEEHKVVVYPGEKIKKMI